MAELNISNTYARWAEETAEAYLIEHGYVLRERNWRPGTSHKEVDIIVQRDDVIAFVEVKALKNRDSDPMEHVTPAKMRNLVRAADIYLQSQPFDFGCRFDIITIRGVPDDFDLQHYEDAFRPDAL